MLGTRLSLRLEVVQKVELKQALRQEQKHFGDFISTTSAICPNCDRIVTTEEIIAGFSNDPYDFNTTCPGCKTRFLSHLIITDNKTGKEKEAEPVIFMCQAQTLKQMKDIKKERGRIGIAYLASHNRQLFYNMIKHWGNYPEAMSQLRNLYGTANKISKTKFYWMIQLCRADAET